MSDSRTLVRSTRQRGIALIIVLWLTIMLTVIASGFAFSMRSEALSARNALSLAQARAAADGADRAHGVRAVASALSRRRGLADGQPRTWKEGERLARRHRRRRVGAHRHQRRARGAAARACSSRSAAPIRDTAARIVDAIQDWRDPDEHRRPNGAEEADYRMAGLKQKPANAPFETVSEVSRVLGVTPAIFARIADSLTVHSRQPGINAQLASRDVLLALPERDARRGRRLPAAARRRAGVEAARAAVSGRRALRRRRRAGVAHPRGGHGARWCNLRPRSGRPSVGRRPPSAAHLDTGRRAPRSLHPSPSPCRPPASAPNPAEARPWPTVN